MDAATLRWTIVVVGIIILAAIFLFGNPEKKRTPKASRRKAGPGTERREPTLDQQAGAWENTDDPDAAPGQGELPIGAEPLQLVPAAAKPGKPSRPAGPPPDKIVTLFVLARDNNLITGAELLQAALKTSMVYGDMNIFHRHIDDSGHAVFSLANALKPGFFDKDAWNTFETSGLALFLTLPGPTLALDGWDMMLATARRLAEILNAEVHNGQRLTFTRQMEAQIREEMRQYDRGRARQTFV
ncbi:MAG TPA: cell division protein ZipA [Xanthomonadales bacterium]|nr:cell division protein ZipA [Xanthomonadales bacterium]